MTNPIEQLSALGQSLWLDALPRRDLENGQIADKIGRGEIRGVTTDMGAFLQAIAGSRDYESALQSLSWSGWKAEQIYWQVAIEDVRAACDLFLPLYRATDGAEGYVSLEVSPTLAHQTEASLAQAKHLWEVVRRPNLMIKIPATKAGLPAIQAATAAGINVNATLIFSLKRYRQVIAAYLAGLDERLQAGLPGASVTSVASFNLSHWDAWVDALLGRIGAVRANDLSGKSAIANARLAYAEFVQVFGGPRFARLQAAGCRPQRPLWASPDAERPDHPDTMYVDSLLGPACIHVLSTQTLEAFRDHGRVEQSLPANPEPARRVLAGLEEAGISMAKVARELERDEIRASTEAFHRLLKTIDGRCREAIDELGPLSASVARRVAHLEAQAVPTRIHSGDPTLWSLDPEGQKEVRIRMGWLRLPESSRLLVKNLRAFRTEIRQAGLTHVLLLGMGGSSLAPEVLSRSFSPKGKDKMHFAILDSTDPVQVRECERKFPVDGTLVIVSSKSGGTAEVSAMLDFFWERAGHDGSRFIAITDPGTTLEALANARGFRRTFLADPSVGGRYSALTAFGLVPACLMGIDLERLLDRAEWMARQCAGLQPAVCNPGVVLGAILGQAAFAGRDKVTLIADPGIASFGSWLEQLLAESSGKQGKGFVPVDGEPLLSPSHYGEDRLFFYLRQTGRHDDRVKALQHAAQPVIVFNLPDAYELGAEFYRWEMATAVGCSILGVNAFDQPDVQDSKDRTKAKLAAYHRTGHLEEPSPSWEKDGYRLFSTGPLKGVSLRQVVASFLGTARKGDYVAVNAYLPRDAVRIAVLQELRAKLQKSTGCATTVGFGPRFQHSTGQLHKGGPNCGVFLQITVEHRQDMVIPNQGLSFAILERAQASGDYEALIARQRRLLRIHLPSLGALAELVQVLPASRLAAVRRGSSRPSSGVRRRRMPKKS